MSLAALVASGCSPRALDVPAAATAVSRADLGTVDGAVPASELPCPGHAVTVLVPDIGATIFSVGIAVDGDEVYVPHGFLGVLAVPIHGGAAQEISTQATSYLSNFAHHLYYSVDACNDTSCPAVTDLDLATTTATTYPTPSGTLSVIPTPSALLAFGPHDILRVDRATGAVTGTDLATLTQPTVVVLGTYAFYRDTNGATWRLDLASNALDTVLPTLEVTAIAMDGTQLAVATQSSFVIADDNGNIAATLAHPDVLITELIIDEESVYWLAFEISSTMHVLSRATQASCFVSLPGIRVLSFAEDDAAVYAVIDTDDVGGPTPLVRIEK